MSEVTRNPEDVRMRNREFPHQSSDLRNRERDIEQRGTRSTSRREFLKATTAGLVASNAFLPMPRGTATAQNDQNVAPERIERQRREARGRLVLKGGTVITMDSKVGDFAEADVLIEGTKIVDIRSNINASARVIDARNMIVIPGLVDSHRHCW